MYRVVYLDENIIREKKQQAERAIKLRSETLLPELPRDSFVYKPKGGGKPVRIYQKSNGKLLMIKE